MKDLLLTNNITGHRWYHKNIQKISGGKLVCQQRVIYNKGKLLERQMKLLKSIDFVWWVKKSMYLKRIIVEYFF